MEVLPCSRIAHIERAHKPYTENLTAHVRRNALRVAEVWMDQYKNHVYMAWNVPLRVSRKPMFVLKVRFVSPCVCGRVYVQLRTFLFEFRGCVTDLLATMGSGILEVHW